MVSNDDKQRVWQSYRDRRPVRVPVTHGVNARVVLLDPAWNPRGITFEEYFENAAATLEIQLAFMRYVHEYLNRYSDNPVGIPPEFALSVDNQNVYDAAYFGCPVRFHDGQVPDVTPILGDSDKERIFHFDIGHPMENPFIRTYIARHEALCAATKRVGVERSNVAGVTLKVAPPAMGWDGPLTIATQLRGSGFFVDLVEDPVYAVRLMRFLQRGAEIRNRALGKRAGRDVFQPPSGYLADDSIQLVGRDMYRDLVLPIHRDWYALYGRGPHGIHLCGDATRHFGLIHRELNVESFDTGFPVDHGALRRELGPDVEILGGPEVSLLLTGTAEDVWTRTRAILESGVKEGGRFILREANNLPPCCPEENLAAMYRACLAHGAF